MKMMAGALRRAARKSERMRAAATPWNISTNSAPLAAEGRRSRRLACARVRGTHVRRRRRCRSAPRAQAGQPSRRQHSRHQSGTNKHNCSPNCPPAHPSRKGSPPPPPSPWPAASCRCRAGPPAARPAGWAGGRVRRVGEPAVDRAGRREPRLHGPVGRPRQGERRTQSCRASAPARGAPPSPGTAHRPAGCPAPAGRGAGRWKEATHRTETRLNARQQGSSPSGTSGACPGQAGRVECALVSWQQRAQGSWAGRGPCWASCRAAAPELAPRQQAAPGHHPF